MIFNRIIVMREVEVKYLIHPSCIALSDEMLFSVGELGCSGEI